MSKFKQLEKKLRKELLKTGSVSINGEMRTYRSIQHEGYIGDFAREWWTQADYDRHAKQVAELKAKGTYGKPYICELTLKHVPEFDEPTHSISNTSVESYSFVMLDFSK